MSQKNSTIHPLLGFLGAFCFGSVFLIGGLGITYLGATLFYEARASLSWHTCEGIITHLEIKGGRRGRDPRAHIRYDYTVEGENYTGSRYHNRGNGVSKNERGKFAAAYPVGTVVTVYYSPSSPETSLLVHGISYAHYVILGFGIVLSFFGTIIVCGSVRSIFERSQ